MGKTFFGIIAVLAFSMLVQAIEMNRVSNRALTCNTCSFNFGGRCINPSNVTCSTNTSLCFNGTVSFPGLNDFGFTSNGCHEPMGCNSTVNGTLLGVNYQKTLTCCSTDNCNRISDSATLTTEMTLSATIGVAILASMWGGTL